MDVLLLDGTYDEEIRLQRRMTSNPFVPAERPSQKPLI